MHVRQCQEQSPIARKTGAATRGGLQAGGGANFDFAAGGGEGDFPSFDIGGEVTFTSCGKIYINTGEEECSTRGVDLHRTA